MNIEARDKIGKDKGKSKPEEEGAGEEVIVLNGVNTLSKKILVSEVNVVDTGHGRECMNESEASANPKQPGDKT